MPDCGIDCEQALSKKPVATTVAIDTIDTFRRDGSASGLMAMIRSFPNDGLANSHVKDRLELSKNL
jgi:hypothetical protein